LPSNHGKSLLRKVKMGIGRNKRVVFAVQLLLAAAAAAAS
jgi:hypothetical protein